MKIQITVIVENTTRGRGILAEHGLAYWIQVGEKTILFDTGQGRVLMNNADKLGIPVKEPDAIVLSHGHYDHSGGLVDVLRDSSQCKIYAHSAAFQEKFLRNEDGTARAVGIPLASANAIRQSSARCLDTNRPTTVLEGVTATGEIPRLTAYEDTGGPFFLDRQCQRPDPMVDDQALFFEADSGTVVLLGCAHSGVINTLEYVRTLNGNRPIHAVLGGMHLGIASADRMRHTIDALGQFEIDCLAPAHCTGIAAVAALWNAFPGRCVSCHAGSQFEFNTETETETT